MASATELPLHERGKISESLQTLAEYLELSLDRVESVVMIRHTSDVCTVYLGDPTAPLEDLKKRGTISAACANEMLELTRSGINEMEIGDQAYRFVRTFAQIGDNAAIVFSGA
ncbi:hypothetical protein [Paraburkholderia sp.]|uniref:hypothetical protein n=1 Tax=Paraburkholderia sp. TaxID=1926495 RepID=UPI003D6EBC29